MKRNAYDISVICMFLTVMLPTQPHAEPTFNLPAGCSGIITIQLENCTVLNHWNCTNDPDGHYWVSTFDNSQTEVRQQLLSGLSLLETTIPHHSIAERADSEDFETLATTGRDTYDVIHRRKSDGHAFRVQGESVLTGQTVTIDGVSLRAVRSTSLFTYPSGETSRKTVMQYIMPSLPFWVPDKIVAPDTNDVITRFGPVEFIWPAEPDFMTRVPTENCAQPMS